MHRILPRVTPPGTAGGWSSCHGLALCYRHGVLQHQLARARWEGVCAQNSCKSLIYAVSKVCTGINKATFLKTWVVLFPFHFVAMTKHTERHMFEVSQSVLKTTSPPAGHHFFPLMTMSTFSQHPVFPIELCDSGSTLHYSSHSLNNTKQTPPPPPKRHLWLDGVRFLSSIAVFERSLKTNACEIRKFT